MKRKQPKCSAEQLAYMKQWFADHPGYMKEWRRNNPGKVRGYRDKASKAYHESTGRNGVRPWVLKMRAGGTP